MHFPDILQGDRMCFSYSTPSMNDIFDAHGNSKDSRADSNLPVQGAGSLIGGRGLD